MLHKSVLIAATAATLLTGHGSRAQTVQANPATYPGRLVICLAEWDKAKLDPKQKEVTQYGRQFFLSGCNKKLCGSTPGARCRSL